MRCRSLSPSPTQADLLLKRQLQWLFLLRTLFVTLLLGLTALIQAKGHDLTPLHIRHIALFIIAVYCFTIASTMLLRITRHYRRAAYLQIMIDILLTSGLIFFSGSSQSVFNAVYFLPIIAGGLLLFRTGGLLMAAVTTICYGALLFLEHNGHTRSLLATVAEPTANLDMLLHSFSINGLSFFLVAILSSTLAERLHKAEAALSQTASDYDRLSLLYKQIFDDITTGVITVDGENRITSFNHAAERITGYRAGEVLGTSINLLFPGLRPVAAREHRPEADLTCKDGGIIPVGYSWARLHTPDGCENCRIFTLQDLSEIRSMEAQVRQAEKMAAIGEIAAGIAHEFRNPLAAISGSAQLLAQQLSQTPQQQKLMQIVVRECDRLEETIEEFLRFSKPAVPDKGWCNLNRLLNETEQLLQQTPSWGSHWRITPHFAEGLECWGDYDQLRQVFLNLCSNSCQAMPQGGEIKINAAEEQDSDGREWIRIKVEDNGPGIAAAHLAKIFDPYFTTRENGTGLGLAIVHQIITNHGGTITAANQAGHGALFTITLPLS